jgi:3D (Asp-Asp-Asp) domain-containing protein
MVDPGTMAVTAMVGTAVGGLISGVGAKESADANAKAYQYKAGVAQINKQVNEQNASWAIQAGDTQAEEKGLKSRQEIGQEKVVQAASGFDVNTGTGARVRDDMSQVSAFDQNVIRWDASKTAYGYEVKAATDTAEAGMDQFAAQQSQEAGTIAEIGSFINAGTSVASKWSQGKTAGTF